MRTLLPRIPPARPAGEGVFGSGFLSVLEGERELKNGPQLIGELLYVVGRGQLQRKDGHTVAKELSRRRLLTGAAGVAGLALGGGFSETAIAARLRDELDDEVQAKAVPTDVRLELESESMNAGTTDWLHPSIQREVDAQIASGTLHRSQSLDVGKTEAERQNINVNVGRLIDGYADEMSINTGATIRFRISSQMGNYVVSILRLGWYGGTGALEVHRSPTLTGVAYPGSKYVSPGWDSNGMVSLTWPVALSVSTGGWRSGYYLASLIPTSTGVAESYIPFVVRDDSSTAAIVMQIPFTTYQAYNYWGGKHMYTGDDGKPATVVSFDRPYYDMGGTGHLFRGDFQVLAWLEKNQYPVTYATSVDTHRNPGLMNGHKVFLSVYHDEYWSQAMRNNAVSWINGGTSLAMLCANNIYWRVRFQSNAAGSPNRVMACYKGFPEPSTEKTILFVDLGQSEAQIEGVEFAGAAFDDSDWVVTNAHHWLYAGTGLTNGSRIAGVVGGEWDKLVSATPADTTVVASVPKLSVDFGPTVQASVVRDMASGATVFAASTLKFGLYFGGQSSIREDPAITKITANLLAHIGVTTSGEPPPPPTTTTTTTTTSTTTTTTTSPPGEGRIGAPAAQAVPVGPRNSPGKVGESTLAGPRRPASTSG